MIFDQSEKSRAMAARVQAFMDEHVRPNEKTYHAQQEAMTDKWVRLRSRRAFRRWLDQVAAPAVGPVK